VISIRRYALLDNKARAFINGGNPYAWPDLVAFIEIKMMEFAPTPGKVSGLEANANTARGIIWGRYGVCILDRIICVLWIAPSLCTYFGDFAALS
jgi:hypothetical protein